jgi:hypothetical protein
MNSTSILKVEFEMLLHKTYNMCNTEKKMTKKKKKKSKGFIKSGSQWKVLEHLKKIK